MVRRSGIVRQNDRVTTWQEWDAETVMNSELPTIPEGEPPAGLWVPLARWWKPEGSAGYLLMVRLDPEPDDGLPYKADIDSFVRPPHGRWHWSEGGGSDWGLGWGPRPSGTSFWFEGMGAGGAGHPFVAPGRAQSEVATVVVRGDGWETACPTELRTGAFLIGADMDELVEISTLDALGRTLRSFTATTIWDALPKGR
jgi:hypothetical protein